MYTITVNELMAVSKVSAQAGQGGVVNKTSVESVAQEDDFEAVKSCKMHISNNTSQTAKKLTKPVPTSTAVKLPPKAVLTHNFFTPQNCSDGYGDYWCRERATRAGGSQKTR
jgi:hypothetical protein